MTGTTPANWKRRHVALLGCGRLFCHFGTTDQGEFAAWIWYEGGAVDGCHQPRTWVEGFEGCESWARAAVENAWPGVIYRQAVPYPGESVTWR